MHITSRDNPKIKEIVRLQKSSAARRAAGLMVCEGPTLLAEAVNSGLKPREVFAREAVFDRLPQGIQCPVYTVAEGVLAKMSDVGTPQGLVFTLPIPAPAPPEGGPMLALDGIGDPGNLGTIVRTADALGASVALVGACVDSTSPKVVRSAMGSLFRVFPRTYDYDSLAALCRGLDVPIYAAALGPDALDAREVSLAGACILIGNEARGVSPQGLDICHKQVIIPMRGAESLNAAVAAAILLWEAVR